MMILFLVQDSISKNSSQIFNKIDFNPSNIIDGGGITISIIGYIIVFLSLVFLWLFISYLSKFLVSKQRKRLKFVGHRAADKEDLHIPGEIIATISMALHLYLKQVHDYENTILTIKKVQKQYSPWSSKVYNIAEYPINK